MPTPVFSKRFIVQSGLRGIAGPVVVPLGHTYVVKQLAVFADPTLGDLDAFFHHTLSGAALWWVHAPMMTRTKEALFGSFVFAETEELDFSVSCIIGDGADVYAGGFDLIN